MQVAYFQIMGIEWPKNHKDATNGEIGKLWQISVGDGLASKCSAA
jgi:hypothetical protein